MRSIKSRRPPGALKEEFQLFSTGLGFLTIPAWDLYMDPKTQAALGNTAGQVVSIPGASRSPQSAKSPHLFPNSWAPPGLTAFIGEEVME